MKVLCDTHVHSVNSFDGESTVREICNAALEKGISAVTITDHMEAPEIRLGDRSVYGNAVKQITQSVKDVESLAPEFDGRLRLFKGMELGEPMHMPKLTRKAMEIADFDFVLASVHNLKDMEDFYYIEYDKSNTDKLLAMYFEELLDTAENADFDSLAHLTYPLRYVCEKSDLKVDLDKYIGAIDSIFKVLIKRDKALEINTSGLFKKIAVTMPDINLVRRFRELGGKYITLGSDAHNCKDLAQGIEQGVELAKVCGFDYFTVFKNRKPEMVEIWF